MQNQGSGLGADDDLNGLREKAVKSKDECMLNLRIYKYLSEETADLSRIETDVSDAVACGMKFSSTVIIRLMVWRCEARMRINDYDGQARYFSSEVLRVFEGLTEEKAADVALNALENTVTRLIAAQNESDLQKDGSEIMNLKQCLKSYVKQGHDIHNTNNKHKNEATQETTAARGILDPLPFPRPPPALP